MIDAAANIACFHRLIFCLGDDSAGKTSLITKLRDPGEEQLQKGSGLEFAYVDVHDEERDGMYSADKETFRKSNGQFESEMMKGILPNSPKLINIISSK